MEIITSNEKNVNVITLTGQIDLFNTAPIKAAVEQLLSDGQKKLMINMTDVSYIDSSGIGALIGVVRMVQEHGAQLVLCGLQKAVMRVFEM